MLIGQEKDVTQDCYILTERNKLDFMDLQSCPEMLWLVNDVRQFESSVLRPSDRMVSAERC